MPLKIAFIGFNHQQTRANFTQFVRDNRDQFWDYDFARGWARMKDGTEITRILPGDPAAVCGRRFDQVIIADDRRMIVLHHCLAELIELDRRCAGSTIPEEYRFQIYDTDTEE